MEKTIMEVSTDERKMIIAFRQGGPLDVIDVIRNIMHEQEQQEQRRGRIIQFPRSKANA